MQIFTVPDMMVGPEKDPVNILFYIRESGPDQIKVKLNYTQNMLCFMIHGRKEIIDENEQYAMDNTQIGLVSSGNMLMTERVTLRQEFESLLLFFSNEFLAAFLNKYQILLNGETQEEVPLITFPKDDYLHTFQRSMKLLEKDFRNKNFRVAKMEEILLYLLEKHRSKTMGFLSAAIAKTQNRSLTQVMQNHRFDNLNTEELAFLCNMSLSTFKRKFYDVFKTSPKKYVVSEKMKTAKFLLQQQKRPSEIYFDLGYENLSSFSKEFKKHYGISPKVYQLQA